MNKNKKISLIIINSIKDDWILILVFVFIGCALMSQLNSYSHGPHNNQNYPIFLNNHFFDYYYQKNDNPSIKYYIGKNTIIYMLFSGPIIIFLAFYFIISFTIHFILSSQSKKIYIWLTMPISRNKLFLSKLLAIYSEMLIIFSTVITASIIIFFSNEDLDIMYFCDYFIQLTTFLVFLLCYTLIMSLVYLYLIDHIKIVNFLLFFVNALLLLIFVIDKLLFYKGDYNNASKIISYIDIFNLYGNQFDVIKTNIWEHYNQNPSIVLMNIKPKHNYIQALVFTIITIPLIVLIWILNIDKFNKTDFHI
ncbi:hypothetical protein [Spiroplasma endosymbiont of Aspidapion aeneum]|uniref:hypothetical protein n=1 Tax=Spiroplasma endosymbiont of Aspidapion aeneum TaxID=3066276 RepID=UPI00313ACF04